MVEATQNGLAQRPPSTQMVDGARPEQQPGSHGVHSARQNRLPGPGQANEDNACAQRSRDHRGVEPATQPRLDRLHQVRRPPGKVGNRTRVIPDIATV
ncbi:hypothetical protein GCM10018771_72650 [Streptomyces cellulosae]|nr:hypothetical protein GCM10018771_72650 [Streptomyces cellulosae]